MKKTFGVLLLAVSTGLSAFGQAPSSLAGLTYRDSFAVVGFKAIVSGYSEALDLLPDGTFVGRFELLSGDVPPAYLSPPTGTYTYVQNSPTTGTLTLNGTSNPGTIQLTFSSASQGAGSGFRLFTLMPTGGDSSARALVNMSVLVSAKQGATVSFGFVVGGSTQWREILIRAVGPSLAQFGINNFAANPSYTLQTSAGVYSLPGSSGSGPPVAWSATPNSSATIIAEDTRAGAFPLLQGSNDKADIILLKPGAYSITVNPTDASGEGAELIEVYEVE